MKTHWKCFAASFWGLALAITAAVRPAPSAPRTESGEPSRERELAVIINRYRQANHLLPLKIDSRLANAAGSHSTDMATNDFFSHVGSDGSRAEQRMINAGYDPDAWGETIAAGGEAAADTLRQWQESPPHDAIMLSGDYRDISAGYAYSAASTYEHYWTAVFGAEIGSYPLVINDEEEKTTSRNVALSVHAPMGAEEMRFRNESGPWSNWESYQSAKTWILSAGDGQKMVSSEVRMGTRTYPASDDIALEGGAPDRLVLESGNYDGGHSNIAIFRPSCGLWSVRGVTRYYFGGPSDIAVSGDYDGDGTAEVGVFQPGNNLWAIRNVTRIYFGLSGDAPAPADYDGDGCCDIALFRIGSGLWAVRDLTRLYHGAPLDAPVPGDYDGDGNAEIAVFRPSNGFWSVNGISRFYFGSPGDTPVPGRWSDEWPPRWTPATFRPDGGRWAVRDVTRFYFGNGTDLPVPANYRDSLEDDVAIFRPSSGRWSIREYTRVDFGGAGDLPATR